MPVVRTEYQTGERLPALLQRDLGGTLTYPLELLGADVAPTSGTCILTDGTTTLHSGAVSVGPPPAFAVAASYLTGKTLGLIYEARWTLVFGTAPAVTRTYRQRVGIVRWAPACPVSHSSILDSRPVMARLLEGTGHDSMDVWIQAGWERCQRWLRRKGSEVHLMAVDSDLYELAEAFAVVAFLDDLSIQSDPGGSIATIKAEWRQTLKEAKDDTVVTYDPDDTTEVATEQRAARGAFYLASWSGNQRALT